MTNHSKRSRLMASSLLAGIVSISVPGIAAVALLAPATAMAQSQTGALRVAVTGAGGAPVSGATVTVSSPDSLVANEDAELGNGEELAVEEAPAGEAGANAAANGQ